MLPTRAIAREDLDVFVFPNPAASALNVVLPAGSSYKLQLHSLTGQLVGAAQGVGKLFSFPLAGLPAGTYVLLVRRGGVAVARRRVIVR